MTFNTGERTALGAAAATIIGCSAILVTSMRGAHDTTTVTVETRKDSARPAAAKPDWVAVRSADEYRVVEGRRLFGAPTIAEVAQSAAEIDELPPVIPGPAVERRDVSARVHNPEADRVTVIGVVRLDGEDYALVEDFGVGETRYVRIGGTAFGYRVVSLEDRQAVLERDGQQHTIDIGAYKPDARRRGGGTSPSTRVETPFGMVTVGDIDQWRNEARNRVMVNTPYGSFNSNDIHNWQSEARRNGSVTTPNGTFTREQLDQWHDQSHANEKNATAETPHGTVGMEQLREWRERGERSGRETRDR